ncbi:MAG TPA: aminomethyl-transferring glycine dehydrogenase subunit GcvPA [Syntrophomonadaceae bacterium]|nr:aminomethyl-transferring glycine dehydrogenase subunit GcvPA [Syntrophomonadaceae bacterium]
MKYTPNPNPVVDEMLQTMGLSSLSQLFSDIKPELQLDRELNIPGGCGEMELRSHLKELAARNRNTEDFPCFLGAGAYDHYIPAALEQLLLRSEFYTAYTPYQPEISQGILQSIFEYQTMICSLTGLDVSNASLYDGGSALAEACSLACVNSKGRRKVVIPDTVHPEYLQILKAYSLSGHMDIVVVPGRGGAADIEAMLAAIDDQTAGVVIQQPNFFGIIEDAASIEQAVHAHKGLLIMAVEPISLAVLKSPGEWGADIAVGEGQPLGLSLSMGGPYLGFMAARKALMRKIPGRIVGQTTDLDGKTAYVLTLQAREQHIRRELAASNICSNQALCALAASMYLTFVGPRGLKDIAVRCHQLALYARQALEKVGLHLKFEQPFFNEFAVSISNPSAANRRLLENGIIGGYELEDALLLAFTEKRTTAEIDRLAAVLGGK